MEFNEIPAKKVLPIWDALLVESQRIAEDVAYRARVDSVRVKTLQAADDVEAAAFAGVSITMGLARLMQLGYSFSIHDPKEPKQ